MGANPPPGAGKGGGARDIIRVWECAVLEHTPSLRNISSAELFIDNDCHKRLYKRLLR